MKTRLIISCIVVIAGGCRKVGSAEDADTSRSTDSANVDSDADSDTHEETDTDADIDTDTTCRDVTPCGGDVVGTWDVTSSCLTVSGTIDMGSVGFSGNCTSTIAGELTVDGTWTAAADGIYADSTTTAGNVQIGLSCGCREIDASCIGDCDRLSALFEFFGYGSFTCEEDPSADGEDCDCGVGCQCTAVLDQFGGMGVATQYPRTGGYYTTEDGTLTITATEQVYTYCAKDGALIMTPQSTAWTGTLTGEIALRRQ